MCVRTWLLRVVAPANEREQNPHLNGFSLACVSTWLRSSVAVAKDSSHWPHRYGLRGCWGQTWTWSITLWVNVFWHCLHRHILISSIPAFSFFVLLVLFESLLSPAASSCVGLSSDGHADVTRDDFETCSSLLKCDRWLFVFQALSNPWSSVNRSFGVCGRLLHPFSLSTLLSSIIFVKGDFLLVKEGYWRRSDSKLVLSVDLRFKLTMFCWPTSSNASGLEVVDE